jgi:hypothetical protein
MSVTATTLRERFYSHVDVAGPDDCWEWTGSRHPDNGYAQIAVKCADGRWRPTHASRVALEIEGVDLGGGLQANHTCDNPGCVNPRHLYAGTHGDNMDDMVRRGRASRRHQRGPKGERNAHAKLTELDVVAIRAGYAAGRRVRGDLDRAFGVNWRTIYQVLERSRWSHV